MTLSLAQLHHALATRGPRALLGHLSPRSATLRRFLETSLAPEGALSPLLGEPVIEATFGWATAANTLGDLSPRLLHEELISALDRPPKALAEHRFPRDRRPYQHQVEAWEALLSAEARSVLVSSGTGSGKTECFMIPILEDLLRLGGARQQLTGTRALMIYPLNALISNQRERLRAWASHFGANTRFCLYNGDTPDQVPASKSHEWPCEVHDRRSLRQDPPPILVTNSTMLEYMLVRQDDQPILTASAGTLRWIVIDEAHTYLGSQAAELALLIRRVLLAFKVDPGTVRVVATSATFGTAQNRDLQQFLADIAGVTLGSSVVIIGRRNTPELPTALVHADKPLPSLAELQHQPAATRFESLASNPVARRVRDRLVEQPHQLKNVEAELGEAISPLTRMQALDWLDAAAGATRDGVPFLPLRAHFFHRTFQGLWACGNSACAGAPVSEQRDWPFGRIFFEHRETCPSCEGLVFPVGLCTQCGEATLSASQTSEAGAHRLVPRPLESGTGAAEDDFELVDNTEEDSDEGDEPTVGAPQVDRLLFSSEHALQDWFTSERWTPKTGELDGTGPVSLGIAVGTGAGLRCPFCGNTKFRTRAAFIPARAGAPYFLSVAMPSLLEHTPTDAKLPDDKPFEGRRLITFTDSRQGSARFALRAQLDSERNHVRSVLYHAVLGRSTPAKPASEIAALEATVAELERLNLPALLGTLTDKRRDLEEARSSAPGRLTWAQAIEELARDKAVRAWLPQLWSELTLGSITGPRLAEFLLLREFLRRPKRQFSLETLGLVAVDYPGLDRAIAPVAWKDREATDQEWRTFLKVICDHFVRGRSAVLVPPVFFHWLGAAVRSTYILAPGEAKTSASQAGWPQPMIGSRVLTMGALLSSALPLSLDSDDDLRVMSALLASAWEAIYPILKRDERGYVLDPGASLELIEVPQAWRCPVTRRLLPRALRGFSPYPVDSPSPRALACDPVPMPRPPHAWRLESNGGRLASVDERQAWLETDPTCTAARSLGVWTELNDRIAQSTKYFRVVEHSAQQPSARLRAFEEGFKQQEINVLSCSTTMEMGVDIGGLSAVGMNNAPPSSANFLQRAGRAGRRGEGIAVSLTLCQGSPHGEAVFRNTLWPFSSRQQPPTVSLSSRRIVNRHVNSVALAQFLATSSLDPPKLTCGWFFSLPEGGGQAPAEAFLSWCSDDATSRSAPIRASLARVTERTPLDRLPPELILRNVGEHIRAIATAWRAEEATIEEQRRQLAGGKGTKRPSPSPAADRAITLQLERLHQDYLLGYLASSGFLPGYGFPTSIVPFVTSTAKEMNYKRQHDREQQREDHRSRRRGFPSRDIALGIRDYAPGSDVVLDGRVFRSSGVTLNWHAPADADNVREIQSFRWAWRCKACGASGTSPIMRESCGGCGHTKFLDQHQYLAPAGFAVELDYEPHNDLSRAAWVPVDEPWVTAGIEGWQVLPVPEFGRYRSAGEGHIFFHSRGTSGHGYAICLQCGRADSEVHSAGDASAGELPPGLRERNQPHRRLRGGFAPDGYCPGHDQPWAIKRHQWLGASASTDVFELQLIDPATRELPTQQVAYSVAAALREALAPVIGVESRELGCAAVASRSEHGVAGYSAVLFDRAGGGAGFASQASEHLPQLIAAARDFLDCRRACDAACQSCLLSAETQFRATDLNRHEALLWLTDDLHRSLALPASRQFFGLASRPEFLDLTSALDRATQRLDAVRLRLHIGGDPEEWDVDAWSVRSRLLRWASEARLLDLVVSKTSLAALDADRARALAALADIAGASLFEVDRPIVTTRPEGHVVAEVAFRDGSAWAWAAETPSALLPTSSWGFSASGSQLTRATLPATHDLTKSRPLPASTLRERASTAGNTVTIPIARELDGGLSEFGKRFWVMVSSQVPSLRSRLESQAPLASISYSDRYVRSPIALRLLLETVRGLAGKGLGPTTEVQLRTSLANGYRYGSAGALVEHDWADEAQLRGLFHSLVQVAAPLRFAGDIEHYKQLPHARELRLRWVDGACWDLRLDQGLGYWAPDRTTTFSFTTTPELQAKELLRFACGVRAAHPQHPTFAYASAAVQIPKS